MRSIRFDLINQHKRERKKEQASATPQEQAKRKEQAAEKKQRGHAELIAGLAGDLETAKCTAAEID